MIVKETVIFGGKQFVWTHSDAEVYVRKVGTDEIYSEAFDLPDNEFEYEETSEKIKSKYIKH